MEKNWKKEKEKVAKLSVASNTFLVIGKLFIGLLIGSVSVISEAIHSGVDLLAAIIAYFAVKKANKPADHEHPYGYGKYENISGTVEALLIFVAAGWIIYEAIEKLIHPQPMQNTGLGIIIMAISAIINWFVSARLFIIGKATDSLALQADAMHLRTDVMTSAGVAVGLVAIAIGRYFYPEIDWAWLDPTCAIAVALLIIKAAWDLTLESAEGLVDRSLSVDEKEIIVECISEQKPNIHSFHDLKTRKAGAERFIEFHIVVDPSMTVLQAHDISDNIVRNIEERIARCRVITHIDPTDDSKERH